MNLLDEQVRQQVRKELADLQDPVKLVAFSQELECRHCRDNRQLAEEIAGLSEKVTTEFYDFVLDKEKVSAYGVDKIPAIVVEGKRDYGIRFYGIPAGYEFTSLIEAMKAVSRRDSGLSSETREQLKKMAKPVHIQVFVTLTCPYCPLAVGLAHRFAVESEFITSNMIESAEFPHLANKYDVFGVPKTIINETIRFEGAVPESDFLAKVMGAFEASEQSKGE